MIGFEVQPYLSNGDCSWWRKGTMSLRFRLAMHAMFLASANDSLVHSTSELFPLHPSPSFCSCCKFFDDDSLISLTTVMFPIELVLVPTGSEGTVLSRVFVLPVLLGTRAEAYLSHLLQGFTFATTERDLKKIIFVGCPVVSLPSNPINAAYFSILLMLNIVPEYLNTKLVYITIKLPPGLSSSGKGRGTCDVGHMFKPCAIRMKLGFKWRRWIKGKVPLFMCERIFGEIDEKIHGSGSFLSEFLDGLRRMSYLQKSWQELVEAPTELTSSRAIDRYDLLPMARIIDRGCLLPAEPL
ncbi:hypothetical protein H5410_028390 [Solanum commersonii]|uniref:Uncharacterized protein n=1 Tax=Solanum commersonii TaxID=4109 RepID=A0A9J5Z2J7_SOLCO|nr:hypothetical protein H5410_028390 [Solanum commersonii]